MEGSRVVIALAFVVSFLAVPLARGQVFRFQCPDVIAGPAGGLERVSVSCTGTMRRPVDLCGYSIGVVAEGGTIVEVSAEDLVLLAGADGFQTSASLVPGGGAVVHAVAPPDGCVPFLPSDVLPMARLVVEVQVPDSRANLVMRYVDGLVPPGDAIVDGPATNRILAEGGEISPNLQRKDVVVAAGPEFRRGDANGDGKVDVSDAIYGLNHLFRGEAEPPCVRAADANGDENLDIADLIYTLIYRFDGGSPPHAPYPHCGLDFADSDLTCDTYRECASATLTWDPPGRNADGTDLRDLGGFVVHFGPRSRGDGPYDFSADVGRVTTYTIRGLASGRTFFSVSAYDWFGNESGFSNEVSTRLAPRE